MTITRNPDSIGVCAELRKRLEALDLLSPRDVKYSAMMLALDQTVLVKKEHLEWLLVQADAFDLDRGPASPAELEWRKQYESMLK